eukprot:GHVU01078615.1.p1 GENE.GHVU01078615.1~~GHVU01078615.1.p1  ORF type:complete len:658 (+),score=89.29 GHVU01078615.1:391-2364(+)
MGERRRKQEDAAACGMEEEAQAAFASAAPYLAYDSHYAVSRCSRACWGTIRDHYRVSRRLVGNNPYHDDDAKQPTRTLHCLGTIGGEDGTNGVDAAARSRWKQEAICHVVGHLALESLEELQWSSKNRIEWFSKDRRKFGMLRKVGFQGPEFPLESFWKRCAHTLEELRLESSRFGRSSEVPGDFRALRRVDLQGDGASMLFASMSKRCASTLEVLRITERTGAFSNRKEVAGALRNLRVVELRGLGSGAWFPSISERCASSVTELLLVDDDGLPRQVPGVFGRLRRAILRGHGAGQFFESVSEHCGPTLEELTIDEGSGRDVVGYVRTTSFSVLRVVTVAADNAVRWFADTPTIWAPTLQELRLDNYCAEVVGEAPHEFRQLRKLEVRGSGACRFALMSKMRAPELETLKLQENQSFPRLEETPGEFRKLRSLSLSGDGASMLFASMSKRCASTLETVVIEDIGTKCPVKLPCDFGVLRQVRLVSGDGGRFLGALALRCLRTLQEVSITGVGALEPVKRGELPDSGFNVLRVIDVDGEGAAAWFASISRYCSETLQQIRIKELLPEIPGDASLSLADFSALREVMLRGKGVSKFFASSLSERCAPKLKALEIHERKEFPEELPGRFATLRTLVCRGRGAAQCRVTVPESCVQLRCK